MLSLTFLDDGGVSKESALCLDGWSPPSSRVRSTLADMLTMSGYSCTSDELNQMLRRVEVRGEIEDEGDKGHIGSVR